MHRAVAVLALSGCNLIFSATPSLDAPGPDADPDGPPPTTRVNGRFHDWYGYSDPENPLQATVDKRQVPLVAQTSNVRMRNGANLPLEIDVDAATFTFERMVAGEPYSIVINHQMQTFEIQHDAGELDFLRRNAGHPAAATATAAATLTFTPVTPMNSRALVTGSGVTRELVGTVFPWNNQPRVNASHGDRVFLADMVSAGIAPNDYVWIERLGAGPDDFMQNNSPQSVAAALQATQPALCANVSAMRRTELVRVLAAQGAMNWTPTEVMWALQAVRSREDIGPLGRLDLALGRQKLPNVSSASDVENLAVTYAQPFDGHDLIAAQIVVTVRDVGRRGSLAETKLTGGTAQFAALEPAMSPSCAVVTFGTGLPVPTNIRLGNEQIDGLDNRKDVSFTRTGFGDIMLSWTTTGGGPAPDQYVVQLIELVNDGLGGTGTSTRITYMTKNAEVAVGRDTLDLGRTYVFRIIGFAGFPGAQAGDMRPSVYPQSQVSMVTTSFTIVN